MDNTQLPAYPGIYYYTDEGGENMSAHCEGFTKLEYATLMIAQGKCVNGFPCLSQDDRVFARHCVDLAKAVLEEANK